MDAVGEIGRVDDEAVFEGEGLVWRAHNGVAEVYGSLACHGEEKVRTLCSSAVQGVCEHLVSVQQEGRPVHGGMYLTGDSVLVTTYRKTRT